MSARYWWGIGGCLAAITAAVLLWPRGSGGAPSAASRAVLQAMHEGQYLRATQLIRARLQGRRDTSAEMTVLLARAEAGRANWPEVEKLLAGRTWLDWVDGGVGRQLLARSKLARGDWSGAGSELGRYLDVATGVGDRQRGIALVRRAEALRSAGKPTAALAAYDAGARELPPIRDWIGWLAAGAAADAGDTAQLRARLAALPPGLQRDRRWALRVRAAARAGDTAAALALAERAADTLPTVARRTAAWRSLGELRRARGDRAGAHAAFGRALRTAPGAAAAAPAARALLRLGGPLTPAERLSAGEALLAAGDAAGAAPQIERYLAEVSVSRARRVELLYGLGRGLFAARRYRQAIAALRPVVTGAKAPQAAAAQYLIARARYRAGNIAGARSTLLRLLKAFPRERATASALFLLGDIEQDAGRRERAAGYFRRVVALELPHSPAAAVADAYMRLGAMAFAARDYASAARTWEAYRRRFPAGERHHQATYWTGRAYARLGDTATARARFQKLARSSALSYYVVRARERLGTPLLTSAAAPRPADAGKPHDLVTRGTQRIDLLHELGLLGPADAEAHALQARLAGDDTALYDLAEALDARGFTAAGLRIGWLLRRRAAAWNHRLLRIVYPFPYQDVIISLARARGLDPYLVAGLIHQESSFSADARSHAGAIGLMQIMPKTGRTLGRSAGLGRVRAAQLERPDVNLQLGTRFVAELLHESRGNITEMLAAYNAGPTRVARWRRFPEARDPELFAERIPFQETRHYVKVVLANAGIYAALYPGLADAAGAV